MSTRIQSNLHLEALATELPFGPWDRSWSGTYAQFVATELNIGATTLAQIIGGVGPSITAITTINFLWLYTESYAIRIGLHGVNAQTSGFTLNAGRAFTLEDGSINALNLYNTGSAIAAVVVAIGGP